MLPDGSNGILKEDLGGEGVPVVYYRFASITVPAVHCECVCVGVNGRVERGGSLVHYISVHVPGIS